MTLRLTYLSDTSSLYRLGFHLIEVMIVCDYIGDDRLLIRQLNIHIYKYSHRMNGLRLLKSAMSRNLCFFSLSL